MDLNDLRYFALIVEHGGFSAAERATRVTKSKLSRRVALLEERLGVRLVQRSTRRLSLTEAGRAFHAHCAAMLIEAEAAQAAVEQLQAAPAGTVRMACPTSFMQFYLARIMVDFMRSNPKVRVEIASADRAINLVEERIDLALRVGEVGLEEPGLVTRRIATGRLVLVASPSYVASHPGMDEPGHVGPLDTIGALRDSGDAVWDLVASDGRTSRLHHKPRLLCSDYTVQYDAATGGIGVALLPLRIAWRGLSSGALLRVAKEWSSPEQDIYLVFVSRRGMLPSVRSLIDHLALQIPLALSG